MVAELTTHISVPLAFGVTGIVASWTDNTHFSVIGMVAELRTHDYDWMISYNALKNPSKLEYTWTMFRKLWPWLFSPDEQFLSPLPGRRSQHRSYRCSLPMIYSWIPYLDDVPKAVASAVSYHWRDLPQVSFLSRQNFCRDNNWLSRQIFVYLHTFVAIEDDTCGISRQWYVPESLTWTMFQKLWPSPEKCLRWICRGSSAQPGSRGRAGRRSRGWRGRWWR